MSKPAKSTWTLYHNPRCGKSRSGLELLSKLPDLVVVEYLKTGLSKKEVTEFLKKLQGPLAAILRTKEVLFKQLKLDADKMNHEQIASLLAEHPALLERPLLVGPDIAIIGRPPENFSKFLN